MTNAKVMHSILLENTSPILGCGFTITLMGNRSNDNGEVSSGFAKSLIWLVLCFSAIDQTYAAINERRYRAAANWLMLRTLKFDSTVSK
jgi:hypothetical protein